MAIKKIPCGGWSYDDSEIIFEDGVIHPIEKSELPEVTSADNGKVLGVVDGKWDKTEAGGGSGAVVVNFEVDGEGNVIADKTPSEVAAILKQHIMVYADIKEEGYTIYCTVSFYYVDEYDTPYIGVYSRFTELMAVGIIDNDSWEFT